MPRHPHEPVTPTLPMPPFPPAPPCGCRPPRMRPEPFSPGGLPAPHGFDFGRWAREKINWLLSLVPSAASADNPLADREWVAVQAVGGKADKVAGATEGNLAALTQDGNLADSGTKPDDFATAAQGAKADTAVQPEGIAGFVDGAEYDAEYGDPPKPTILLKHGSEVVATVDAADFVIDGMVSNVEVKNGNLVITFNTDSGKQPISIPLTDIFDPANYYTKTDVDGLLAGKASTADATLTFSAWQCVPAELIDPLTSRKLSVEVRYKDSAWELLVVGGSGDPLATVAPGDPNARSLEFNFVWNFEPTTVTATRAYQLGDQSDKPLASEAEAEALRQGKQDKLTFDDAPTSGSNNSVKSGGIWSAIWGALSALPTGFTSLYDWVVAQLSGKASKADATLAPIYSDTPTFSEWTFSDVSDGITDIQQPVFVPSPGGEPYWGVALGYGGQTRTATAYSSDENATNLAFEYADEGIELHLTATRTRTDIIGYQLGSQSDKPLASEAEAEALRQGKQDTLTFDNAPTSGSNNPVKSSGIWSAIWGALAALPTGFTSLYDWCVSQLAGKASKSDVDPLLFAQYYPDGSVKSAAEFTSGIKYNFVTNGTERTATVKPFCTTGDSDNDNSNLSGRVVIPPFVDGDGNPYISDDGTRYKVVGVNNGSPAADNTDLTTIVASNTMTNIGKYAFYGCVSLASVSLPAVTNIGKYAFYGCVSLASVSLPAATSIGVRAFANCTALTSVSLPAATDIGIQAFEFCSSLTSVSLPSATSIGKFAFVVCSSLASVDFGDTPRSSVPSLGADAFDNVPTTCKIIVPDAQYDAWTAASGWSDLVTAGYKFLRHSEWEYARKYEVDKKADKPATFTTGNLAKFDSDGNPTDSGIKPSDKLDSTSAAPAFSLDSSTQYPVGSHCTYNGKLYKCTTATTGGTWVAASWTEDAASNYFQYALTTKTIDNGAVSLDDRAINIVTIDASDTSVTFTFPSRTNGKARDFFIRLIIQGATPPTISFVEPGGGAVSFDSADDRWAAIDVGTNILMFTDTAE